MKSKWKCAKAWRTDPLRACPGVPVNPPEFGSSLSHKQLIQVETEMLDEEINNLSGCPASDKFKTKRGAWWHCLGLSRIGDDRWFMICIEASPFPRLHPLLQWSTGQIFFFLGSSYDHYCDAISSFFMLLHSCPVFSLIFLPGARKHKALSILILCSFTITLHSVCIGVDSNHLEWNWTINRTLCLQK